MSNNDKETKFFIWLRSGLRRLSRRWPPIFKALELARIPYSGENKRKKWIYKCADCKKTFDVKEVSVDHIQNCGSLKSKEDIVPFIERLFCDVDQLQVLCQNCHDLKSIMERYGYSKQQAINVKKVKSFEKMSLDEQAIVLTKLDKAVTIPKYNTKRVELYKKLLGIIDGETKT